MKELGVGAYVNHLGGIDDRSHLKRSLLESDALLLPTYYRCEAQAIVVIEAMSAGLPVISTDQPAHETFTPGARRSHGSCLLPCPDRGSDPPYPGAQYVEGAFVR